MSTLRSIARCFIVTVRKLIQRNSWRSQSKKVKSELVSEIDSSDISSLHIRNALILCPHADDEWIGCSSILSDSNVDCHVLYYRMYGYNQSEINKKIRDSEIEDCARCWNFNLLNNISETIDFISESILRHEYDTILLPSPIDWHWEHRSVFCNLIEAINKVGCLNDINVLYYYVSVPCVHKKNVFISNLTKDQQHMKWLFFEKNYISQIMPIERFMLQEKINGIFSSSYASEIFLLVDKKQLSLDYRRLQNKEFMNQLDQLKELINDLFRIRIKVLSLNQQ